MPRALLAQAVSEQSADKAPEGGIISFCGYDPDTGMLNPDETLSFSDVREVEVMTQDLETRLLATETSLRNAEQALADYDRIEGTAVQASIEEGLLAAISDAYQQLQANNITLAAIDTQMQRLQDQLGMTPAQAAAAAALSTDPSIAQLRVQISDAETEMALLQNRGMPAAHPERTALYEDLATYSQLLQARAAEIIGGNGSVAPIPVGVQQARWDIDLDPARVALANQLVSLKTQSDAILAQQEALGALLPELRQQHAALPNKAFERNRIAQRVARLHLNYDRLQSIRVVQGTDCPSQATPSLSF